MIYDAHIYKNVSYLIENLPTLNSTFLFRFDYICLPHYSYNLFIILS